VAPGTNELISFAYHISIGLNPMSGMQAATAASFPDGERQEWAAIV
jgi:hypothetical protein